MILGADGVQVGSRFIATPESSAHMAFKERILTAEEGDTKLTLKEITPVRLLNNPFYQEIQTIYEQKGTSEELAAHLGRGRAKKGMFEGDLVAGELEVGQVSAMMRVMKPAGDVVKELITEFNDLASQLKQLNF
jgi:enoyl-[acyl-carrier protein] reductase II